VSLACRPTGWSSWSSPSDAVDPGAIRRPTGSIGREMGATNQTYRHRTAPSAAGCIRKGGGRVCESCGCCYTARFRRLVAAGVSWWRYETGQTRAYLHKPDLGTLVDGTKGFDRQLWKILEPIFRPKNPTWAPERRSPSHRKRHAVDRPHRCSLARPSQRIWSVEDGGEPFPPLARGGGMGSRPRYSSERTIAATLTVAAIKLWL
jgi:hypothetical protein